MTNCLHNCLISRKNNDPRGLANKVASILHPSGWAELQVQNGFKTELSNYWLDDGFALQIICLDLKLQKMLIPID